MPYTKAAVGIEHNETLKAILVLLLQTTAKDFRLWSRRRPVTPQHVLLPQAQGHRVAHLTCVTSHAGRLPLWMSSAGCF